MQFRPFLALFAVAAGQIGDCATELRIVEALISNMTVSFAEIGVPGAEGVYAAVLNRTVAPIEFHERVVALTGPKSPDEERWHRFCVQPLSEARDVLPCMKRGSQIVLRDFVAQQMLRARRTELRESLGLPEDHSTDPTEPEVSSPPADSEVVSPATFVLAALQHELFASPLSLKRWAAQTGLEIAEPRLEQVRSEILGLTALPVPAYETIYNSVMSNEPVSATISHLLREHPDLPSPGSFGIATLVIIWRLAIVNGGTVQRGTERLISEEIVSLGLRVIRKAILRKQGILTSADWLRFAPATPQSTSSARPQPVKASKLSRVKSTRILAGSEEGIALTRKEALRILIESPGLAAYAAINRLKARGVRTYYAQAKSVIENFRRFLSVPAAVHDAIAASADPLTEADIDRIASVDQKWTRAETRLRAELWMKHCIDPLSRGQVVCGLIGSNWWLSEDKQKEVLRAVLSVVEES